MYLLEYKCPDCGTMFYAEEREGILLYCPYCYADNIEKTGQEIETK